MNIGHKSPIGGKVDADVRVFGLSDRAIALTVAGGIGILLSVGLAMSLFLHFISMSMLAAVVAYIAGVVALIIVSPRRRTGWRLWIFRLIAPLPGALLLGWGLSAIGL